LRRRLRALRAGCPALHGRGRRTIPAQCAGAVGGVPFRSSPLLPLDLGAACRLAARSRQLPSDRPRGVRGMTGTPVALIRRGEVGNERSRVSPSSASAVCGERPHRVAVVAGRSRLRRCGVLSCARQRRGRCHRRSRQRAQRRPCLRGVRASPCIAFGHGGFGCSARRASPRRALADGAADAEFAKLIRADGVRELATGAWDGVLDELQAGTLDAEGLHQIRAHAAAEEADAIAAVAGSQQARLERHATRAGAKFGVKRVDAAPDGGRKLSVDLRPSGDGRPVLEVLTSEFPLRAGRRALRARGP
jgi:hypothetical protein